MRLLLHRRGQQLPVALGTTTSDPDSFADIRRDGESLENFLGKDSSAAKEPPITANLVDAVRLCQQMPGMVSIVTQLPVASAADAEDGPFLIDRLHWMDCRSK